jgi:hypothetical protein
MPGTGDSSFDSSSCGFGWPDDPNFPRLLLLLLSTLVPDKSQVDDRPGGLFLPVPASGAVDSKVESVHLVKSHL